MGSMVGHAHSSWIRPRDAVMFGKIDFHKDLLSMAWLLYMAYLNPPLYA